MLLTSHGPRADSLEPRATGRAPRSLRHPSMERRKPDGLFRQVVRRRNARVGNKPEELFEVLAEPLGQVGGVLRSGLLHRRDPDDVTPDSLQRSAKRRFAREFVPAGDRLEQFPKRLPQPDSIRPIRLSGVFVQELDITDQVRDTELQFDVLVKLHELAVGRKVVAADRSVEVCPKRFE